MTFSFFSVHFLYLYDGSRIFFEMLVTCILWYMFPSSVSIVLLSHLQHQFFSSYPISSLRNLSFLCTHPNSSHRTFFPSLVIYLLPGRSPESTSKNVVDVTEILDVPGSSNWYLPNKECFRTVLFIFTIIRCTTNYLPYYVITFCCYILLCFTASRMGLL